MTSITIYADYVCPYCLLAERVLSDVIGQRDIRINWRAFELRPAPVPTLRPEDAYLPTVWRDSVYPSAERLGLSIRLPSISPQPRSDAAFEILAMAQDQGLDHMYSMRVLRAFFQEDRDIGQRDVLLALAAEVGLDPDAVRLALDSGALKERHRQALRHARDEMGITAVPTIVIGQQVFRGTPPVTELRLAVDRLVGETTSAT
ncbi:MAG: DsbA family protein [Burkholderiaceae bacterium]|nr:DsbA family protein [Burkholderiaceae bacterium]